MARSARDDSHDANGVPGEALEQRLRRLEDAVAAIQDTQLMEDRVVERVIQRVDHAPFPPLHEGAGVVVTAARMLLPKTVDAVPENGAPPPTADGPATDAGRPWMII